MRRMFSFNLILMLVLIIVDQSTKLLASNSLLIHKNFGVFLGFFSNAPVSFRVITLATFSAFLLFIYLILLYMLPNKVRFFKLNFTLIISGVFGNVIDRLKNGYTIDFIPVKFNSFEAYYNIADIYLWVGVCYFIYSIFKYEDLIWHPDNSRNKFLVFPREQFMFALKVSLASLLTSFMIGIFSITFIKSFYSIYGGRLFEYSVTFVILSILFACCIFLVSLIISHKTAGPVFAFKLYMEKIMNEHDSNTFSLRDGDNYQELEKLARELKEFIDRK